MSNPIYSFTLPSIHDDLSLDCRIFHSPQQRSRTDAAEPNDAAVKGAIVAHPYAPLGGSFDDPVVTALAKCLLDKGYVVMTFNFRGAGDSAGKTSWTGKPEVDDYISMVGFLYYYLDNLKVPSSEQHADTLSPIMSRSQPDFDPDSPFGKSTPPEQPVQLLLAGYSFGSLILARLPAVAQIFSRFETAERGTAAAEIFLRARVLAKQTRMASETQTPRGRKFESPPTGARSPHSPAIVMGGEETSASERRRSREARRSGEIIRDIPHNIKSHLKHHQHQQNRPSGTNPRDRLGDHHTPQSAPAATIRYLLISPVLMPWSTSLLSPGLPFTSPTPPTSDLLPLQRNPTLILFGANDTFTSSKKLRQWSQKLAKESWDHGSLLRYEQIEGAGHFWREEGVMKGLKTTIGDWLAAGN